MAKKEVREKTDNTIVWVKVPFNPTNPMLDFGKYCTWRDYPFDDLVKVYLHKD